MVGTLLGIRNGVQNIQRVALPEQERLQKLPNLLVSPMLAEDVGRIIFASDVVEDKDAGSNSFSYSVERQCCMALVEFHMRRHRTINNRLVVSEHVALGSDRNSEVSKCGAQVNNLLRASSGCNEFGSVCSGFDGGLLLREPVYRCLVDQVKDRSNRLSCK